jgi:hypothetical protein
VLVSVTDADIASAGAEAPAASRIQLQLSAPAASAHASQLENALLHAFRLSCNGQSLFVGVVYVKDGAAAIQTPVMHVARDSDDALVLQLGAWLGAWALPGVGGSAELKQRLDRPELRAALCRRGVLREL